MSRRVEGPPILEAAPARSGRSRWLSFSSEPADLVTYTVLGTKPADQRSKTRLRTRLRSSKVIDMRGGFLADCLVHDCSDTGARLRLADDVVLPQRFAVFDDITHDVQAVDLAWRRGAEIGVRFRPGDMLIIDPKRLRALAAPFYAMS